MDDEMEEAVAEVFVCFEVDLDYEFDAPRFFDLAREETAEETRTAESWFGIAGSYPPSPLITKLIFDKDIQVENTSIICDLEDLEYRIPHAAAAAAAAAATAPTAYKLSLASSIDGGCKFESSILQGATKNDQETAVKVPFSGRSTLMKPTASQLAKQNCNREVKPVSRFRKQLEGRKDNKSEDIKDISNQAPKRQRLESGHCCKMQVTGITQQTDFFHKVPEKPKFVDTKKNRSVDVNNQHPRLKLTIPRDPELKTARRAVNLRAQQQRMEEAKSFVGAAQNISTFKALPLNRKILEGPSLPLPQKSVPRLPKFKEFNFRTHERALQHSTATSSSISDHHIPNATDGAKSSSRLQHQSSVDHQMQDEGNRVGDDIYVPMKFKAQALNQKILASKGDFGIFRSTKRELTKPKEFKFSTSKRNQQTPLSELFNKLTVSSEEQRTSCAPKFPLPSHLDVKGSKENLIHSVQQ